MQPLEGIAAADALLGRPFPLPAVPLPLARWVEVRAVGEGAEVEWNLDDTRPGAPGRLALYVGTVAGPDQLAEVATERTSTAEGWTVLSAPLPAAQPSLRPVVEVTWQAGGLHLRLTAQGPWTLAEILRTARSVGPPVPPDR
jgi:hypothetical protein